MHGKSGNRQERKGKDSWNWQILSLEWKAEGVIDGEGEGGDCDEVNQEDSEQDEVDWMKTTTTCLCVHTRV